MESVIKAECIAIPVAALESPEYLALSVADKYFLIELYRLFSDCARFTIDTNGQDEYRQPKGANLRRKVKQLIRSGLIYVVAFTGQPSNQRRVFAFKYAAFEYRQAA